MSVDIEKENIVLQRFMWSDNEHKCEAGKLLCTLTELVDTDKHTSSCDDESIKAYLKDKGIAEDTDAGLKLVSNMKQDAEQLGNQISQHIDHEIESLPLDKAIRFITVHTMAVPLPCCSVSKKDDEKTNKE